jgi:signal transduction histidine kinase
VLQRELAELRESRKRLLLAADDDRRRIERDLHEGVQQHLVALAVNLQLAGRLVNTDPAAAKTLLEEMERDLQQALDETARLAQRVYPSRETGGLAAILRSVALSAGIRATVDVDVETDKSYPPELVVTVHQCWLEALEHAGAGTMATVTVREQDEALVFEVVANGEHSDAGERLRDRVEALGGRLTVHSEPGPRTRISGRLPLSE